MVKGILSSAAAMRPALLAQSVLANNLANTQTTAFRQDRYAFQQGDATAEPTLNLTTRLDDSPGAYDVTTRALDLALQGDGYFVVETPDGERYTRGGHFALAADGTLITAHGYPVLADGGPLVLPRDADLLVHADGTVSDPTKTYGKLQIVSFEEGSTVTHTGSGLHAAEAEPVPAEETRVLQGVLEGPNVEAVQTMVDMITLLRHFEMNQKALQAQDETLGNLIDWARA